MHEIFIEDFCSQCRVAATLTLEIDQWAVDPGSHVERINNQLSDGNSTLLNYLRGHVSAVEVDYQQST